HASNKRPRVTTAFRTASGRLIFRIRQSSSLPVCLRGIVAIADAVDTTFVLALCYRLFIAARETQSPCQEQRKLSPRCMIGCFSRRNARIFGRILAERCDRET